MAKSRAKLVVSDRDLGWDKLGREIRKSARTRVTAGIHSADRGRTQGSLDNVQLGVIHEFGKPQVGIPERSFIRLTVDEKLKSWQRLLATLAGKVYALELTEVQALNIIGLRMASDIQNTITKQPGSWDDLKPATIARKGSTQALIDTRELIRSIRHRLVA